MKIKFVVSLLLVSFLSFSLAGNNQQIEDPTLDLPMMDPKLMPDIPKPPEPPAPTPPAITSVVVPTESKEPPKIDEPHDVPPPPTLYGEEISSENDTLYYVIDVSGSMGWADFKGPYVTLDGTVKDGTRLDRAKVELTRSIMSLPPSFRFNIVAYSCFTYMWQPGLQPADDWHKGAAITWVNTLQPLDNTGTGPATALALGDKDNQTVVLLTDGEPNCPDVGVENHRKMISNQNTQHARVNVFGIRAYGQWRAFCQNVAADSGGSYIDVP